MKRSIILFIILLIPLCVFSNDLGISFPSSKYMDMTRNDLSTELFMTNLGTGISLTIATGTAFVAGVGVYFSYYGVSSMTRAILDSPFSAFSLFDAFVYGGIIIGGSVLAGIGYLGLDLAIKSIQKQSLNRKEIKIALKQFHPTSYKDSPGIGIGISIALD